MQVEANRPSVDNDSSQWIRLKQQGSQSMRSLEEEAGSSTQQHRWQDRDVSSLSTALWAREQHLASVGEGVTVCSGLLRSTATSRALTVRTQMSWKCLPTDKQQHNSQGHCDPNWEGNHTRSSIACSGNSKKTINLLTHSFHNSWLHWVNWRLLIMQLH